MTIFRSFRKHVAVTKSNIQTSVELDGNPEPDYVIKTYGGVDIVLDLDTQRSCLRH
jgi:hypothetical protein